MAAPGRVLFTCPVCKTASSNPHDVAEGYCGRCHQYTGDHLGSLDDVAMKLYRRFEFRVWSDDGSVTPAGVLADRAATWRAHLADVARRSGFSVDALFAAIYLVAVEHKARFRGLLDELMGLEARLRDADAELIAETERARRGGR